MRKTFLQLVCLLTVALLVLSACNMPGANTPAEPTQTTEPPALPPTATFTLTAAPTEIPPTDTPAPTATETPTPEPSATATPVVITAKVGRESNCRIGPGGMYDLVVTYQAGQMLEVVARDLGGGYVFVKNPEKPEDQCYLLANNVTISGDIAALPQFTPRPSPTAAPYFNVSFRKFEACKGVDFAMFNIENVGSIAFRSGYIRLTDPKADKSVEQAVNAFDLMTGCIVAQNIAPLDPGAAGYIHTPPMPWSRGNKLQVVVMLCTDKDLKGTCVTRTLEVKQ